MTCIQTSNRMYCINRQEYDDRSIKIREVNIKMSFYRSADDQIQRQKNVTYIDRLNDEDVACMRVM